VEDIRCWFRCGVDWRVHCDVATMRKRAMPTISTDSPLIWLARLAAMVCVAKGMFVVVVVVFVD
jgi:hypothetical protein